jgi:hypothetical protein
MKIFDIFYKILYMWKIVGAGIRAEIFYKLELEPHKNGPAPQKSGKSLGSLRAQSPDIWLLDRT